ncbi:MAG: hypothetical protein NTW03_07050 [Verrucomicrobia bacterium]|nr:hypothetical protein [Verrucomicrobiota bacterium]
MKEQPDQGELEARQREDEIANRPGRHADDQNPFQPESGDTESKDRHKEEF